MRAIANQSVANPASRRFALRLIAILSLPVLMLVIVVAQVYRAMSQFVEQNHWVNHTFEVKQQIVGSVAALRDAESALRAHALSGNAARLADYYGSLPKIAERHARLLELVADNPMQSANAQRLGAAFAQRQTGMAALLAIFLKGGSEAVKASPQSLTSQQEDKAVDGIQSEMLALEERLLVERQNRSLQVASVTKSLIVMAILISFSMMALALAITLREQKRRLASEAHVIDSNQQLAAALGDAQRMAQSLRQLSDLGEMLQSCHSMNEALTGLRGVVGRLLPGLSGSINLLNASRNLVEQALAWGDTGFPIDTVFSPDECWALRRGHAHPESNALMTFTCRHVHPPEDGQYERNNLCVPLVAQGQMLGTLFLSGARGIDENARGIAVAAGEHISMSIANLQLQETLRHQSLKDPLTGLFNRRYLESSFERELARSKRRDEPLALLMVDIDHFKQFNDEHGHEAGDVVLAQFGAELGRLFRPEDVLCRYGGEEFTILIQSADALSAQQRAERLCAAIRGLHLEHRRRTLGAISVSVGIAVFPEHGDDPASLMRLADAALYRAKRNGRDQFCIADGANIPIVGFEARKDRSLTLAD